MIKPSPETRIAMDDAVEAAQCEVRGTYVTPDYIIKTTASYFHMDIATIKSKQRNFHIVWPRWIAFDLLRRHSKLPYTSIAAMFGKDHGTVMSGISQLQNLIATEKARATEYANIRASLFKTNIQAS